MDHYSAFDALTVLPDTEPASHDSTTNDDDIKTTTNDTITTSEDVQPPNSAMRRAADHAETPDDQFATTDDVKTADNTHTPDDDDDDDDDDVKTASVNITPGDCIKTSDGITKAPDFITETPDDVENTSGDIETEIAQIVINAFTQGSQLTFIQSLTSVVSNIYDRKRNMSIVMPKADIWRVHKLLNEEMETVETSFAWFVFARDHAPDHVFLICPRPPYEDIQACNQRQVPGKLVDDCFLHRALIYTKLKFLYWSDNTCPKRRESVGMPVPVFEPPYRASAVPDAILCMLTPGSLTHPPTALVCILPQTLMIQSLLGQE